MKIKGSAKNLQMKSAFFVALAGTIVALIIRIYQSFSGLIDFETGFFTENSITTPILYGVLGFSAVAIFVICLLSGKAPQDKLPEKKNIAVSVASGCFAILLVFGAVASVQSYFDMSSTYDPFMAEQTHFSYLMKSGALPRLLEGVFGILSAIYFIILTFKYAGMRNADMAKMKFFSLCPLFWATFRMIQRFTRTISFMNVSSLFLELFMIAFMMMFFMYLAQMSSEVNNRCVSYKVVSYGLIGGMFAAVVAIPGPLLQLFDSSYKALAADGLLECPVEIADFFFCLFAFVFAMSLVSAPQIKNMTVKESEKIIEEEK